MVLKHVALVCSSEDNSDKFYEQVLGLPKISSKLLPRELSGQIFNLDSELKIVNYADDSLHFEIFIHNRKIPVDQKIEHVCVEVPDLKSFLEKCDAMGVHVLKIPKQDKLLVFVTDFDGNLFEIKAKNS